MKLSNKPTSWILALLWVAITIIEASSAAITGNNIDFTVVSWAVVFNLAFQTLSLKLCGRHIISFFYAFVAFYYLFHFGQVIMMGLFPTYEFEYLNYVEAYMEQSAYLGETLKLCIVSINAFFIGGLLIEPKFAYKEAQDNDKSKLRVLRKLFFVLLPIRVAIDAAHLIAAMYMGYYAAIAVSQMIPGVIACLGGMWYAMVSVYYLTLKNNKEKRNFLVLVLGYLAVTMLTGNRGHQIVCVVSLFLTMLLSQNSIKVKTLLKYGALGVLALFLIDIIYEFRETSISEFLANPTAFMESSAKGNILLETIGTFGETIYTPFLVVEGYDSQYHTWFGEAFIKSIPSVIPDAFGWFSKINDSAIFQKQLGTESAIGGSFCGEMYYNFGAAYPYMSVLFGALFSYLSDKVNFLIRSRRYEDAVMSIVMCSLALWWVRDCVGNYTRQVVWIYWLMLFFKRKK